MEESERSKTVCDFGMSSVTLRSESKNGVYKTVGYSGKPSYMDKGLKSRKTYFYKVYAVSGKYRTKETGPVKQTTKAVKK